MLISFLQKKEFIKKEENYKDGKIRFPLPENYYKRKFKEPTKQMQMVWFSKLQNSKHTLHYKHQKAYFQKILQLDKQKQMQN